MVEKYRLQYWDTRNTLLSIGWAGDREDYVAGDCRVRAIKESTDVDKHNKRHKQRQDYTRPMTLDEARAYIARNTGMLGSQIHDCVGLALEDLEDLKDPKSLEEVCKKIENIEFDQPIRVRNH